MIVVAMVFAWAAYIAGVASASEGTRSPVQALAQMRETDEQKLMRTALQMLEAEYFMEIGDEDKEKLVYGAIEGMTSALRMPPFEDDFSHFYDPELYQDLEAQTTGEYAGVGILMGLTADGLYPQIINVFPETPASGAGIEPDDIIVEIDEEEAFGMILPEVATRIKGPVGTEVKLKVFRPAESEYRDFEMVRNNVQFSSVTDATMLADNVGYLQINSFAEQTAADFVSEVNQLLEQGMEGLVMDLRNNSGGLFPAALDMANLFLEDGDVIVEVVTRGEESQVLKADNKVEKYQFPLIVIMNANSASSSEILVGALKDHGIAKVIGERSYGKGVIQAVEPMETEWIEAEKDGKKYKQEVIKSALAITIGKYLTPNGNDIHRIGIEPNIWFDINNRLEEDPALAEMEEEIQAELEKLRELRARYFRYLRDNDATRDRALDVMDQLLQGLSVADVPQLVMEEELIKPLAASPKGLLPEETHRIKDESNNEEE